MWGRMGPGGRERDFRLLSDAGLQLLRVFPSGPISSRSTFLRGAGVRRVPTWEDLFRMILGQAGIFRIRRWSSSLLSSTWRRSIAPKLLIGLLTGWIDGRLHLPPRRSRTNLSTDPVAIQWEVRFVREFVGHPKHPRQLSAGTLGMSATAGKRHPRAGLRLGGDHRQCHPRRRSHAPRGLRMHGLSPTGAGAYGSGGAHRLLLPHPYLPSSRRTATRTP